jgi:hypothetical protein
LEEIRADGLAVRLAICRAERLSLIDAASISSEDDSSTSGALAA